MSKNKKHYLNNDNYWLYGKHPVISAVKNPARKILKLCVTKNTIDFVKKNIGTYIEDKNIKIEILTNIEISSKIGINESIHQGIAIMVKLLKSPSIDNLINNIKSKSIIMCLDQINDPQNIGAIIRSSLAFAADAVITTKDNAPSESASLVKASAGAFELIPYIQVVNMARTLKFLKDHGFWVVSITQNGDNNIDSVAKFDKIALVLGSEGKGIRDINLKQSDVKVKVDMSNKLESLNVSNAAAIILHQLYINLNKF
jgi:23S rRNA (guanosine2251-2'-O)-methyltransferase